MGVCGLEVDFGQHLFMCSVYWLEENSCVQEVYLVCICCVFEFNG